MKPKQHNILHYKNVILRTGPLKKSWAMKHEMYHRQFKRYSNVSFNRQNLPLSITKKECLRFSERGFDYNYYSKILVEKNKKKIVI